MAAGKLPQLFIYDHCPFCVRARVIFGLKNVKHNLVWMANDDVDTPTALVGKKIAPILEMPGEKPMPESLDIVKRVDEDATYGSPLLKPASDRQDLSTWDKKVENVLRLLLRPRYIKAYLPEFAFPAGREAYMRNHPIADPATGVFPPKDEWQKMGLAKWQEWYAVHFDNSPALLEQLNSALPELEGLIHSPDCVSPGGPSYDDVIFFGKMRGATLIKGWTPGPKLQSYLQRMSELTQIPLYSGMAI